MRSFFLFLSLVCLPLQAEDKLNRILEGDDITLMAPYVEQGTVLVFDLDDTLVRCQTSLGSSPWFYGKVEGAVDQGVPFWDAIDYYSEINALVAKHLSFEVIDQAAKEMIQHYQDQGIIVVALTARPSNLMATTLAQLDEMGVDFGKSLHVDGPFIFDFHESFGYQRGVLFVSDKCSKEQVLEAFVDQLPRAYPVERVVFADDKIKYLHPMAEFAERRGLEFVGLRYSHEDNRKDLVSLEVADRQLELLHSYLPTPLLEKMDWLSELTLIEKPLLPKLEEADGKGWVLFGRVIPDNRISEAQF